MHHGNYCGCYLHNAFGRRDYERKTLGIGTKYARSVSMNVSASHINHPKIVESRATQVMNASNVNTTIARIKQQLTYFEIENRLSRLTTNLKLSCFRWYKLQGTLMSLFEISIKSLQLSVCMKLKNSN